MKTILVPTDFSKNAINALYYAIAIAKREKARIILLHAFHINFIPPDLPVEYLNEEIENAEEAAKKQMNDLYVKLQAEKVKSELIIRQDMAIDLILEVAEVKKPDFIIMGTKGASGLKEIIIGSTTAAVIERAKCPVIAVPENSALSPINHITYATDYLESDIDSIKKLVRVAGLFKADITLLHVADEKLSHEIEEDYMNKFKSKLIKKIKYERIKFKITYGKHFIEVLENYVKEESPDLLAMSTHYRSIYDKLFGTSYTKKMAYHTNVPLLAFHNKQDHVIFI